MAVPDELWGQHDLCREWGKLVEQKDFQSVNETLEL